MIADTGRTPRVAIVGGGITGLSAAFYLLRAAAQARTPVDCVVIESAPVWGGKVQTEQAGPLVLEQGPDSFLARKPWARDLCLDLGLGADLIGVGPQARRTYILHRRRLEPLPPGLAFGVPGRLPELLRTPLLSMPGKLRALLDLVLPASATTADESLGAFLSRRVGREATERLAEPLLAGIYAGDIWQLSLAATFPMLRDLERKYGSLTAGLRRAGLGAGGGGQSGGDSHGSRGGPGAAGTDHSGSTFLALRRGLSSLTAELVANLAPRARLVTGTRVQGLAVADGHAGASTGRYLLEADDGSRVAADAVILALPAFGAADLLAPLAPEAAQLLSDIPHGSVAVVACAYPAEAAGRVLDGSGFLVPRGEGLAMTACTWVSSKWPPFSPAGDLLLRCYVGRSGQEQALRLSDAELTATIQWELRTILDLRDEPSLTRVYRWPRSMPQYMVGHLQRMDQVDAVLASWPGILLAGAGYRGLGLPDCVRQGREAGERSLALVTAGRQSTGVAAG